MRLLAGCLLVSLTSGCYLFSDEPKARKHASAGSPKDEPDEAPEADPEAGEAGATDECPEFLTGVERGQRTIAASCGPVRVRGRYQIDGGQLILRAGTELRFDAGAVLEVGRNREGQLIAEGRPDAPIRLLGSEAGGAWEGMRLHPQAGESILRHVEISGAGTPERAALWVAAPAGTIEDLTITEPVGLALEIVGDEGPELRGAKLPGIGVVARTTPGAAGKLRELELEPTAFVEVGSGPVVHDLEWPATSLRLAGIVRVEGEAEDQRPTLIVPGGASLYFAADAQILVGGFGPGTLTIAGQVRSPGLPAPVGPDEPTGEPGVDPPLLAGDPEAEVGGRVRLLAADDAVPGSWSGIRIQDQGALVMSGADLVHGGAGDRGVVLAEGSAELTILASEFRDCLVGVELRGHEITLQFRDNIFTRVPVAVRASPALLAALAGEGSNRFDEHAQIELGKGKLDASAIWPDLGVPVAIRGDLFVEGGATLKVEPGVELRFDPGVVLGVGYYSTAGLEMRGTAHRPIVLGPALPPASHDSTRLDGLPAPDGAPPPTPPPSPPQPIEPWGGIVLGNHARDNHFEHVQLRATANDAGIELRGAAEATLVSVECAACANATVRWSCKSQIGNVDVRASEGTPTAMLSPGTCK